MSAERLMHKRHRWVVKIGSSLLTNEGRGLNKEGIATWVEQIVNLRRHGHEVVLVSSGSVAEGMVRLGLSERPRTLHELQAAAAVGQMGLVQAYESCFNAHDMRTAQVLLTHDDLSDRRRYLNARSTLRALLRMGVVPVVNENDTVVTDEIRFGDNDTLGALVANLIEADLLVILTDQEGLCDKDPRHHTDAQVLHEVEAGDPFLLPLAGGSGSLGRGGMLTKVKAAALAARSGTETLVAHGGKENILCRLRKGEQLGTYFRTMQAPQAARKQWLAGHLQMRGRLQLDAGAVYALRDKGTSLLAVGIHAVDGHFQRGEMVACCDEAGQEVARGLINYNADEVSRVMGRSSTEMEAILGYLDEDEIIHRDNLILL